MKQHFVEFFSPGTIFSESTTKEIDSWDVDSSVAMARGITVRHGATPYGFQFTTRERDAGQLDSKETGRSGMYFLGGTILTLGDVRRRNEPNDEILISNMETNNIERVICNTNSWRATLPFTAEDARLEFEAAKASSPA